MNNQQAFDAALFGIRAQNYQRSITETERTCAYRGIDGAKCAVGHCIPDELYNSNIEGMTAIAALGVSPILKQHFKSVDKTLLSEMQRAHDVTLVRSIYEWEDHMSTIAKKYDLVYTPA